MSLCFFKHTFFLHSQRQNMSPEMEEALWGCGRCLKAEKKKWEDLLLGQFLQLPPGVCVCVWAGVRGGES